MIDIKVNTLTKDYKHNRGIFKLDFEIKKGEIFGFVGTNGSGKTTTIRHIMGFLKPQEGDVEIRSLHAYKDATKTKEMIGYIPGEIAFPDLPSGLSFIKSQAEFLKLNNLDYANQLIKVLQIDLRANTRKMSKGMKQKTAIIAALMNDSDILILDEPTTGLDPLMRQSFLDILENEKAKGKTILISSHMFEELEDLCDRVALIKDGKIIDIAQMSEIKNPSYREYKIEFLNKEDYLNFQKTDFKILKTKDKYQQVFLKINKKDTQKLLITLANYQIKFITENKYNLEKHFQEVFKKESEASENDQ